MTAVALDARAVAASGGTTTIPVDVVGDGELVLAVATAPEHGTAEVAEGGDAFVYTADDGYVGDDSFAYTVTDASDGSTDTATVSIEVLQEPPPSAVESAARIAALSAVLTALFGAYLASHEEIDGQGAPDDYRRPEPAAGYTGTTGEMLAIMEPHYRDDYPGAGDAEDAAWDDFAADMEDALDQLEPDGTRAQVDRMAEMSATAITNHITHSTAPSDSTKTWWTMLDNRVRATHRPMHSVSVGVRDKFRIGSPPVGMDYPGQPVGDIELWVNCRCVMTVSPNVTASVQEVDMTATTVEPIQDMEEEYDLPETLQWHAVLAPEGERSGDGRSFSPGSLSFRDLPLPLRWQREDVEGHEGAIIIGTIEDIVRDGGLVLAQGSFLDSDHVDEAVGQIMEGALKGVSIDVDDAELAADPGDGGVEFSKGRICAATVVAIPAFPTAYIAFGPLPDGNRAAGEIITSDTTYDADAAEVSLDEAFAVSEAPWDGAASRFTPEQYKRSCVLHKCDGLEKSCHSLPIEEPGGALSRAAVHAAAARFDQVQAPAEAKASAKRRLRGAYRQLNERVPDSLVGAGVDEELARGAGWVTNPESTKNLHDYWTKPGHEGYAKIRWGTPGDFRRLRRQLAKHISPAYLNRVVAQWHHDALGYWPGECGKPGNPPCGAKRGAEASDQGVNLVAAAARPVPARYFDDPALTGPTPLIIDGERVYGHIAIFGECHIGIKNVCTTPPRSTHDYAYFRTGAVLTDKGRISVGQITMGTGHAELGADPYATASHYDNTGTVVADVACGEDDHGIWISGRMRDSATSEQVHALQAGAISGDWRAIGGNLELIAALVVNVPGFPVPRPALAASAGRQTSLVAAGVVAGCWPDEVKMDDLATAVAYELHRRQDLARRLKDSRSVVAAERVAALIATFAEMGGE